jgi:Tol biopolymer transport system component
MWNARKHSKLALTVLGILFCSWLLVGCEQEAGARRLYVDNLQVPKVLAIPTGNYTSAAWLADDQLAFVYESNAGSPLNDYYVALYSEQDEKWKPLEKIQPEECQSVYYRQLNRLPDGGLGFLVECYTKPTGFHFYLYERNLAGTFAVLSKYPDYFPAGRYSFSPDRAKYVQEEYHGSNIDRLYTIKLGDSQMQQLLSEYKRTRSPSWSPDGRTIAFAGNITVPEPRSNPFSALPGIADVEFYPWELFLMDADGANVRSVLSGVKQADLLKWSPLGRWLAFRGQYQEVPGIWILDTVSSQVVRVWPEQSLYVSVQLGHLEI